MPETFQRLSGVVEVEHLMPGQYGGAYGVILGDDGKRYVYSRGEWFRNCGPRGVGAHVSFVVVSYSYATEINSGNPVPRETS
jgi:hypothetical protein